MQFAKVNGHTMNQIVNSAPLSEEHETLLLLLLLRWGGGVDVHEIVDEIK